MTDNKVKIRTRMQNKHDFEINWLQATFIPLEGELIVYDRETALDGSVLTTKVGGVETAVVPVTVDGVTRTSAYTYNRVKIGDGITQVNNLPFISFTPEERDKLSSINQEAITSAIDNLISCGSSDPNASTTSQYYFKYSE